MARAMWKGSLNFGLVNIPVQLQLATSQKDVRFHQFHDEDGGRIREKRVCEKDGAEVPYEHIVKGYEISKSQFVTVTAEELKAVEPAKEHTISIEGFVTETEIDPIYYDRTYYVVPDGRSNKAYSLLTEALGKADRVGIGRFVISTKEHLCAVKSDGKHLRLATLVFGDEVVDAPKVEHHAASSKELEMANALIAQMKMKFDPEKLHDTHRDRVLKLIERKAEGKAIVTPATPAPERIADLAAALERSLAVVKGGGQPAAEKPTRSGAHPPRPAHKRHAARHRAAH